jgi:oligopeptide transport system substrate-binding protein
MKFCYRLVIAAGTLLMLACTKNKSAPTSAPRPLIFQHFRSSEEKTLDPVQAADEASRQIIRNVYDTLLEYHYLKRPYQLQPALLETLPELMKDGRTYLFTLKKNVWFHDDPCFPGGKGRTLTTDDVIYTLKRFADSRTNSVTYDYFDGVVEGMNEFRKKSKAQGFDFDRHTISGFKKLDDWKFTVTFIRQSSSNLNFFSFVGVSIVASEAVKHYGSDFDKHPVGTGPFQVKDYKRRTTLVLYKNARYHQNYPVQGEPNDEKNGLLAAAGKKLPFVDEVRLPLIEETQPQILLFTKGELHWIAMNRDLFEKMAENLGQQRFQLKPEYAKLYNFYAAPNLAIAFFSINMKDPVLGVNKKLRQALAMTINPEGFIQNMLNGRGIAAQSLIPLEIPGSARDTGSRWFAYNPAKAKALMAEAGYPEGKGLPPFTIEYRSATTIQRQQYEFVRHELEQIGVKVLGNFQTFTGYLEKIENGRYQMADAGWTADDADASGLYALFYSKSPLSGANIGRFRHERYDELFERSRYMENSPQRLEMFREMDAILKDEAPMLLLNHPLSMGILQKSVLNFKHSSVDEYPYRYLDLAAGQGAKP